MAGGSASSEDFRSVVLPGVNVASYKFALAKSILSLAEAGATSASLEELAVPYSRELCEHIRELDTQSTSAGSRFLDVCRHYNAVAPLPRVDIQKSGDGRITQMLDRIGDQGEVDV